MITEAQGMAVLGVGIPFAAAILKFVPQKQPKENGNSNGNGKYVSKDICQVMHAEINRRLQSIETKIDRIIES